MGRLIACLVLLFDLHVLCIASQNVLPLVKPSEYASMGKISQFVGHINDLTGLKSALTACSCKNEIILISTTSNFVDAAAQTIDMLRRFGIAHVIIVSSSEESCKSVAVQIQGACCVWEDFEVPPKNPITDNAFGHHRLLMQTRSRTAARTLRLGYNIMFLDTDIVIFEDPYKYLKQPPFSDMHFMAGGGVLEVNLGIMYVQNVSPDGPVAWMFAEAHDRVLRWSENFEFISSKTVPILRNYQHLTWDQSNFGDTVLSAVIGRPVFQAAWVFQGDAVQYNSSWVHEHLKLVKGREESWNGDLSPQLKAISRSNTSSIRFVSLNRPFTQGQWPPHLGGPGFPSSRGKYSQAWQNKLTDLGSPMWPDPDDPVCHKEPDAPKPQATARRMRDLQGDMGERSDATVAVLRQRKMFEELQWETAQDESWGQAAEGTRGGELRISGAAAKNGVTPSAWARLLQQWSTAGSASSKGRGTSSLSVCPGRGKVERMGFLPDWISATWSYMDKSKHQWNLDIWPPTQVFGHCLFLINEKRIYKNAMKMTYGWYNWTLANQSRAGQIYFASTPEVPIPKVLEASGELLKRMEKMGIIQFLTSLRALHTAAAVLGRALAWPYLDCSVITRFIHEIGKHPTLKRHKLGRYYQTARVPFTVVEGENNKCMWTDYLSGVCLDGGVGLLPPEHVHLKSTLPEAQRKESQMNTLSSIPPGGSGAAASSRSLLNKTEGSDVDMDSLQKIVSSSDFLSAMKSLGSDLPIVYLDFLPQFGTTAHEEVLSVSSARLDVPKAECWALTLY